MLTPDLRNPDTLEPETSRNDVIAAIDRFRRQRATATGSGIILSLTTPFPDRDAFSGRRGTALPPGRRPRTALGLVHDEAKVAQIASSGLRTPRPPRASTWV